MYRQEKRQATAAIADEVTWSSCDWMNSLAWMPVATPSVNRKKTIPMNNSEERQKELVFHATAPKEKDRMDMRHSLLQFCFQKNSNAVEGLS